MTKTTLQLEHGHQIIFDSESHKYIKDDSYVIGMSSILGLLANPGLENWKINTQINYIKKEMEQQGLSLEKIDSILLNARTNAKKSNEQTLSIGSVVHKYVEKWLKGETVSDPDDEMIKKCFEEFKKFWTSRNLEVVESEKILYSERGYAGTLDIVAKDKEDNLWLIDVKTSSGIFISHILQVHGYKLAYEEQTGKKIKRMYILRLPKTNESFEARQILYKKEHAKAFLGLLNCHKAQLLFNEQSRKFNEAKRKLKKEQRNAKQ